MPPLTPSLLCSPCFLLVNFAFEKKSKWGGGGGTGPPVPPGRASAKTESDRDCDVHLCLQSFGDF